jgi:hypothetical protein
VGGSVVVLPRHRFTTGSTSPSRLTHPAFLQRCGCQSHTVDPARASRRHRGGSDSLRLRPELPHVRNPVRPAEGPPSPPIFPAPYGMVPARSPMNASRSSTQPRITLEPRRTTRACWATARKGEMTFTLGGRVRPSSGRQTSLRSDDLLFGESALASHTSSIGGLTFRLVQFTGGTSGSLAHEESAVISGA